MAEARLDPERGLVVAAQLRELGVRGILVTAAERGYITQLVCGMRRCYCPKELGGATHFESCTDDLSDWRSDWMPTVEHFPIAKRDGGHKTVENVIVAHRLCNRIDYSKAVGRSHRRDLERIERAREEAMRRNDQRRKR